MKKNGLGDVVESLKNQKLLFDKIWDAHRVATLGGGYELIYIARHMLHELASDVAFEMVAKRGNTVRRPDLTFATHDHVISTAERRTVNSVPDGAGYVQTLRENTNHYGIELFDLEGKDQGIVHVIAPELAIALPGLTFVCGDSHTCTVGGIGALSWGIGTSDVAHVLATQTLVQRRPSVFRIRCTGNLPHEVTAKDIILAFIGEYGAAAGTNFAIEYCGKPISQLSIEERLTLCNLSIEMGSRMGQVAPDDVTFDYLNGRKFAPAGRAWDEAVKYWRSLTSDDGASACREETFDLSNLEPQITWGTSPAHVISIREAVPDPRNHKKANMISGMQKALAYMDLVPGQKLTDIKIDAVFIGSCTNSRISDLRSAASIIKGRKVAGHVRALVVPGSTAIRRQAEEEGLDKIFKNAGFEWRQAGCSMCVALNDDRLAAGQRCVSTSNRNFEGRQGWGSRTHLASPLTATASALAGRICDQRMLDDFYETW